MKMEQSLGRVLIIAGILLAAVGAAMIFSDKIPLLGKLPGDIRIERENFRFYVPIGTSILISVVLTVILWIISLLGRK
jgi:cell division protein FtsW (lipid II flippase)